MIVQIAFPSDLSKGFSENMMVNVKLDACKLTSKSLTIPMLRALLEGIFTALNFELKCPYRGMKRYTLTNLTSFQDLKNFHVPIAYGIERIKLIANTKKGSKNFVELINCVFKFKIM